MYRRRNTRTDQTLLVDGDFCKIGPKHYQHCSGAEIKYDCNSWSWEACGLRWKTLEWAAHWVRKEYQGQIDIPRVPSL